MTEKQKKKKIEPGWLCRQSEREREGRPGLKAFVCSFQTDLAGAPALQLHGRGGRKKHRQLYPLNRAQQRNNVAVGIFSASSYAERRALVPNK